MQLQKQTKETIGHETYEKMANRIKIGKEQK